MSQPVRRGWGVGVVAALLAGSAAVGGTSLADGTLRPVSLGPDGGSTVAIAVHPNLVVAGTGDDQAPELFPEAMNVWASTDDGKSWRPATRRQRATLDLPSADGSVPDPHQRGVRYRIGINRTTRSPTLEVSIDGGRRYTVRSRRALRDMSVQTLSALETRRTTLLVGAAGSSDEFGATPQGVRRSTDGGYRWVQASGISGYVYRFTADPSHPRVVYAVSLVAPGRSGLFKSVDGGASWRRVGRGLPYVLDGATEPTLAITRQSSRRMIVASSFGVYRSLDGGVNWRRTLDQVGNDVAIDPRHPNVVYAATWIGVYRSADGGRSWRLTNRGIHAGSVNDLAVAGMPAHVAAAGFLGRWAVVNSDDSGAHWMHRSPSKVFLPGALVIDPTNRANIMIVADEGLLKSVDAGRSWHRSGPADLFPTRLVADRVTGRLIVHDIESSRIVTSDDFGAHWTVRGTLPTDGGDVVAANGTIYSWTDYSDKALWRSFDSGQHWTRTAPLGGSSGTVAVAPSNPRVVYATMMRESDFHDFLLRSSDGGTTWHVTAPLTGPFLQTITVDQADPNHLYGAFRWSGLWESSDAGGTWTRLTSAPKTIAKIVQNRDDPSALFLATDQEGVWSVRLR